MFTLQSKLLLYDIYFVRAIARVTDLGIRMNPQPHMHRTQTQGQDILWTESDNIRILNGNCKARTWGIDGVVLAVLRLGA